MRLIWEPEGSDAREWQFTTRYLRTAEAEAIEGVGGRFWEDLDTFDMLFRRGNRRALRAALWIVRRRDEPGLTFESLDLRADEVKYDPWGEDEKTVLRERMLAGEEMDPLTRVVAIEVLGEDPTAGSLKEKRNASLKPKIGSPPDDVTTDGLSPSTFAAPRPSKTSGRSKSSTTPAPRSTT